MKAKKIWAVVASLTVVAGMASAAYAADEVTISFSTWNPNENTGSSAFTAWEALDNGIHVEFENLEYNDYVQDLKVKMAAGEGPDVFGMQDGALMNEFSEYLYDITDLAKEEWGDDWESQFNPLYLELIKGKHDAYYGLPLGGTSAGYFYTDQSTLAQYGIENVPTNYDELKAACDKIREQGGATVVSGVNNGWAAIDLFMSIAGDINQEKMYAAIAGEADWTDPELVEAFNIFQKMFTDGIFVDGQMGGVDCGKYFAVDRIAPFFIEGSWLAPSVAGNDLFQEAIAAGAQYVPVTMDWNNDGKAAPVTTGPNVVLCINKNSENIDAAWEFMKFMVTDGVTAIIDNSLEYLPSSEGYEIPEENFDTESVKIFNFAYGKISDGTAGYREMPYTDLKAVIIEQLQLLGLEEVTPEEAASAVQEASLEQER